jgi:hypothetical protein
LISVYRLPGPEADGAPLKIRIPATVCGGRWRRRWPRAPRSGCARSSPADRSDDNGTARAGALSRGVDVADAVVHHGPNQFAVIWSTNAPRTHGAVERDDTIALDADELRPDLLPSARVVHVDDVDQLAAIQVATMARATGAIVTSDIDRVTDRTEDLVAAVSIPILAEHVPAALTGESEVGRALRGLHDAPRHADVRDLGRSGR